MSNSDRSIARYRQQVPADGPPWLKRMRETATERFTTLRYPSKNDEAWRFTNIAPIAETVFDAAPPPNLPKDRLEALRARVYGSWTASRLVFVDGYFVRGLSHLEENPPGLLAEGMADLLRTDAGRLQPHLARYADFQDSFFTALNTAYLQDGAFLYLPPGRQLQAPIHLMYFSSGLRRTTASHPRALIIAEEGSQAQVIESWIGLEPANGLTNAVTEVVVGENAHLDHILVVREPEDACHVGTLQVHQTRNSSFVSNAFSLGGALVRRDLNVCLDGEGAECTLNGLLFTADSEHVDHHTSILHARPRCRSAELYKQVLDGTSHAVFNGRIQVNIDAFKTDAQQMSRTLLLSNDAVIDSQPQLEIYADDVRCNHGATVGRLDDEALFYLRSRGVAEADARRMLSFAFMQEMIDRVRVAPLRAELEALCTARFTR